MAQKLKVGESVRYTGRPRYGLNAHRRLRCVEMRGRACWLVAYESDGKEIGTIWGGELERVEPQE
jgi:hypothetical protein